MGKIKLNLKKEIDNSYEIEFLDLNSIVKDIKKKRFGNKYFIITDSNVEKLYSKKLFRILRKEKINAYLFSFKDGEKAKTLEMAKKICQKMAKFRLNRDSCLIALGGGVVGDLTGLAASIYMRGINYIQIPTTLLAQVDSSIGGKTAVDLPEGKNLIGVFYQPKKVYLDINFLKTLSRKQILNGLAEIIKYGLIADKNLFRFLKNNLKRILKPNFKILKELIKKSIKIKTKIVEQDEKEKELRRILNYGHTIGHALEIVSNFKVSHGEAIALGMVLAGKISNKLGYLDNEDLKEQNDLIKDFGLPIKFPQLDINRIIKTIEIDKKIENNKIRFILLKSIGKAFISNKVTKNLIIKILKS